MISKELAQQLQEISNECQSRRNTVAAAESVTAGYIQYLLSNMPDASLVFQGGITAYNCAQKAKHLSVEPIYAERQYGVAPEISGRMARAACNMFNAEWGIGITGYADAASQEGILAYLSQITH